MNQSELSPKTRSLAKKMAAVLRDEYQDHCRARTHQVSDYLERLRDACEALPPEDSRLLLRAVRPLLGYEDQPRGERQHQLVLAGRELARIADPVALAAKDAALEKQKAISPSPGPGQPRPYPPVYRLTTELRLVKEINSRQANLLAVIGLNTIADLLNFFPRRWEDRSVITPIANTTNGAYETVKGRLGAFEVKKTQSRLTVVESTVTDASGRLSLIWFNQAYLAKVYKTGHSIFAHGKIERNLFGIKMSSPEIEYAEGTNMSMQRLVPIYRSTGNLPQAFLRRLLFKLVPTYAPLTGDPVPPALAAARGLLSHSEALIEYHWPSSYQKRDEAQKRIAYEELLILQMQMAVRRQELALEPRCQPYQDLEKLSEDFLAIMPFAPTGAQQRVFHEIVNDLADEFPMNRLLQGDVGSGKTMVAAFAAFIAIKNGFQVALMAPTEILAEQHFHKLKDMLEPCGISVGRLQGSMTKAQKRKTCEGLQNHDIDLAIGTHALIQEGVEFHRLGLAIVDEQHKFGVMQRTALRQKAGPNHAPDLLVMTATPIPRTLSLTLYGDLDVSRLDELPPGRRPIQSHYVPFSEREKVYELIRRQLEQGRQAYIVCPLIDESDKLEAAAAVQEAETLSKTAFKTYTVGLLHGKMKAAEKESVMEAFRSGQTHVLISTTVIEVGVDVPNATVMLVQNADRFGLAQLHQLRGRIGRGQYNSTCYFMGQNQSASAQRKLQAIAKLSDGFEVAEEDLEIRGPGDYYGTRQSGVPELRVADLIRDAELLDAAHHDAEIILHDDPFLERPETQVLKHKLQEFQAKAGEMIH